MVHVGLHRVDGHQVLPAALLGGVDGRRHPVGVGQRAHRGAEQVQDGGQHVLPLHLFALYNVFEVHLGEQGGEVVHFRGVGGPGQDQRHTAVEGVVFKGVLFVAAYSGVVFGEAEGVDPDLVAAAPELRENIGGQHFRVAAGDVDVQVVQGFQVVESVVEGDFLSRPVVGVGHFIRHLDLVHKEVEPLSFSLHHFPHPASQLQGIAVADVPGEVQGKGEDVVLRHALFHQVAVEQVPQQVGLPAPADAGDDLHLAVPHIGNELVEIPVPLDLHHNASH